MGNLVPANGNASAPRKPVERSLTCSDRRGVTGAGSRPLETTGFNHTGVHVVNKIQLA